MPSSVENLCDEMSTILNTLKEIAYREEVPFEKDISITVTDGHGEYETRMSLQRSLWMQWPPVIFFTGYAEIPVKK